MLWTFSMRSVDVGRLLLSAWQGHIWQRRHCRTKDWPYSQAAQDPVPLRMSICFDLLMLQDGVIWDIVGHVLRGKRRFELLGIKADSLRLSRWLSQQCRGHFQCDQWTLDDCCSQSGTK